MPDTLSLRPVTADDLHAVWELRNEPAVREASLDTAPVPLDSHERWFHERLADPQTWFRVVVSGGAVLGYVRFLVREDGAEISIALLPQARGDGGGTAAIRQACRELLSSGVARRVVARVREDNLASLRAFAKAGFVEVERGEVVALELAGDAA